MRYFLELKYKGTHFAGFQIQKNAKTVQQNIEDALQIVFKTPIVLTGSSRTDSGVHALQNFFHFDVDFEITRKHLYSLNAIISTDIYIINIKKVADDMHCRFTASHRKYHYFISTHRNPFTTETAWHYPFTIDINKLNEAAKLLQLYSDFTSFSKKNTQTFTNNCTIEESYWTLENDTLKFTVKANRFLRGMVRALVATMLHVGRGKLSVEDFKQIIEAEDCSKADFSAPAHGLFLAEVGMPGY